jgi:hypothetical protein
VALAVWNDLVKTLVDGERVVAYQVVVHAAISRQGFGLTYRGQGVNTHDTERHAVLDHGARMFLLEAVKDVFGTVRVVSDETVLIDRREHSALELTAHLCVEHDRDTFRVALVHLADDGLRR